MAEIISKFEETYKSTDSRSSMNHKPEKHEENYTKPYPNHTAQNQSERDNFTNTQWTKSSSW